MTLNYEVEAFLVKFGEQTSAVIEACTQLGATIRRRPFDLRTSAIAFDCATDEWGKLESLGDELDQDAEGED